MQNIQVHQKSATGLSPQKYTYTILRGNLTCIAPDTCDQVPAPEIEKYRAIVVLVGSPQVIKEELRE